MTRSKHILTFSQTDTVEISKLNENGFIKSLVYVLPNLTTAVSGVLTIQDTEGHTIYTSGTIPENATTLVSSLDIPADYGYTFTFTLNAGSGAVADETVSIKAYIKSE